MSEQPPYQNPAEHQPQNPPPNSPQNPQPRGLKQSRASILVKVLITLVALGALVVLFAYLRQDDAANAAVGQCLERSGDKSVSIVECGDAAAQYKVVGRLEDRTQFNGGQPACSEFDEATEEYWEGKSGEKGFFLCLAPIKRP